MPARDALAEFQALAAHWKVTARKLYHRGRTREATQYANFADQLEKTIATAPLGQAAPEPTIEYGLRWPDGLVVPCTLDEAKRWVRDPTLKLVARHVTEWHNKKKAD